ncbi:hypothetical protein [Methanobacterium sp.]|uniref:hypothetical protein n=1 Tax=Methanobacterium sp. TaxID=2164 RepID=UPI003C714685
MFSKMDKITENIGLNLSQLSILMISLSIILWSISIYFSKVDIGNYGLISGLNPLFFVAISLLTISFFITVKYNLESNKILVLHLIWLVLFIILIPVLIEGTPRFPYNFETTQSVDYILQNAHSNSDIVHYQCWPGVFYFDSIIYLISNISPFNSILIIPILFNITFGIPLTYLLYSTFLNKKETWAALLLSNVLFFGSPIYLLPGIIGGAMTTFALLIMLRFEFINSRSSWSIKIIFIIFVAAAVVSHFLSMGYFLMTLIFISVLQLIFKKYTNRTFILVFVLIITWQFYLAGSFALDQIFGTVHTAFNLESTLSAAKQSALGGSQSHAQVFYLKLISIFLLSLLALMGLIYEFLWKRRINFKNLILPTWIASNLSITGLTSYGGEILSRTFSASNSVLNMLAAKTINNDKLSLILLIVLLISPPLSIINAYGNEAVDYIAPVEIEGANFMFDHYANSTVVKSLQTRVWNIHHLEGLENWNYDPTNITLKNITPANELTVRNNYLLLVGKNDIDCYVFLYGSTDFSYLKNVDSSNEYNKIYASPGFDLYYLLK